MIFNASQRQFLVDLSKANVSGKKNSRLLQSISQQLQRLFLLECCDIIFVDLFGKSKVLVRSGPLLAKHPSLLPSLLSKATRDEEVFVLDQAKLRTVLVPRSSGDKSIGCLVWISIRLNGKCLGLAIYGASKKRRFSRNDIDFARAMARFILVSKSDDLKPLPKVQGVDHQALRQADEDLQRLAYVASHDLQEPLRTIDSWMHILKASLTEPLNENAAKSLVFIDRGIEKMQALLKALLEYSRASRVNISKEYLSMKALLISALENLQPKISQSSAQVKITGEFPELEVEAALMTNVFQSIIANAVEFRSSKRPKIHISSKINKRAGEWVFKVTDNGVGLEPSECERAFELFTRLHSKNEKGAGIGLSIVRKVVERHGGKAWITRNRGSGISVFFSLPKRNKGPHSVLE